MATKTVVTVISKIGERPVLKEAALVMIYGLELGRKFNLGRSKVSIGRGARADIQIDQESVSRQHARIVSTGKAFILHDCDSTNGTYVNDELIEEHELQSGDLIKIGRTIFKFLSGDSIENAYHEEIYRLTTIDGLTQISNKRFFLEALDRELGRARRYRRRVGLLLFDIDHFKQVNDSHGHLAGDHVLKQLATAVRDRLRREDVLARYGGEEFAIVLPEVDQGGVRVLAEKVRRLIEKTPFLFEGARMHVTVSIGTTLSQSGDDPAALIKRADARLYDAKHAGRNCIRS